jgi:hypothetical protein
MVEEDVYTLVSPSNGAGPLWCYGCTQIVRVGEDVIVSQMETGEDVPLLCNTRWRLLRREADGWQAFAEAEGYRQREPCPVGLTSENDLFLYVNDSLTEPGTHYQDCEPHLLRFGLDAPTDAPRKLSPQWSGTPYYTDHSYRGFGVDAERDELLLLNIDAKTSVQHWAHLTAEGETLGNGGITFPIRACYPQVALKNRSAHVMAIGDIVEPVDAWRTYKFEQTQRKWDYVFRILYYTYTPKIGEQGFSEPIEIANVDDSAGAISNQDLWIAPDGTAYVLYREQEIQTAMMRDKFFPDKPDSALRPSLLLAVVRNGEVVERRALIAGTLELAPGHARFHESTDGTLYVVVNVSGSEAGNKLLQVYPKPDEGTLVSIPLKNAFGSFCVASVRAGCKPSDTLDIFGHTTSGTTLSYAQIRLK